MKRALFVILVFFITVAQAQTVKIPISNDIRERNGKQFYVHTVERGQTVYSISKAYNVTINEIYFENPSAKNGIVVGQKLWIPTENKETEIRKETKQSDFDFFYHIAARDETFKHISSIYLIPEKYIRMANPGLKEPLREGEYVKVPVESAFPVLDGHPVSTSSEPNTIEDEARRFSATSRKGDEVPKYKPPKVETDVPAYPEPKTESKLKTVQTTTTTVPGQVAFNPDIPVIKDYRHVVVMGETLESIAKKYRITVRQLKEVNPGLLMAAQGQRLRLPATAYVPGYSKPETNVKTKTATGTVQNGEGPVVPPSVQEEKKTGGQQQKPGFYYHKVKKKETLYSISRLYGVTLDDLYKNNPGLSPRIKTGQTIKVPKKKIRTNYLLYTPPANIRLKKLAKMYGISYSQLKSYNPLIGKKVYAGQPVKIPVGRMAWVVPVEEGKQKVKQEPSKPEVSPGPLATCRKKARNRYKTYKVALMVPLFLEEADSLDLEQFMTKQQSTFKPFRFIKFLEGALFAADSLRKEGINLRLYVYDVDNKLTKTANVLSKPELREMDLIIGPFYSASFAQTAMFAGRFHIPIVNPVTFREEVVTDNDNVIKVKPGLSWQKDIVLSVFQHYYANSKVFLITQTSYKDADKVIAIQNGIEEVMPPEVAVPNSDLINVGFGVAMRDEEYTEDTPLQPYTFEGNTVDPELLKSFPGDSTRIENNLIRINYMADSLHPFERNASVLRNNLVIIYGDNKGFIMDAVNRLNRLTDTFDIKIIGLPLWERLSNPNYLQLNNLQAIYPASVYVNYDNPGTGKFLEGFYAKYFTDPESWGILGFDVMNFFGQMLMDYGTSFEKCLPETEMQGISTRFRFKPSPLNQNSFENSYWNILQIRNKKLIKLPDFPDYYQDN